MKKIIILIMAVSLVAAGYGIAEAGVVNTKHDMYDLGKGTDANVCSYCHVPHNAAGDKIWSDWGNEAQLTSGPSSTIGNMCYTCHDGVVTSVGLSTVFNTSLQQHKTGTGTDCDMCHTVHDNTNGKFVGIVKTTSAGTESETFCETCHSGATMDPNAASLGDHIAGSEHPYQDSGSILDDSCNSCHQMHGAADYTTTSLTNPILKMDNADSQYCGMCHSSYIQSSPGGNKHPANLGTGGTWGKAGCETCHDVHQPTVGHAYILKDANVNSAYCVTCHDKTDTAKGPSLGDHSHPIGGAFTTIGLTPSGSDIDDDGDSSSDYKGNSATLVCETCHSPHQLGVDDPALRITSDAGALCINCHNDK